MMRATRVGARLFLAVVLVGLAGCPSDTPTSAQVELVGTLMFTRMGQDAGHLWTEEGTADLSVKAALSQLKEGGALVGGSGTGEAKYELSMPPCLDTGKYSARYVVNGFLDTDPTCRLRLRIDVYWTNGVASAQCAGMTVSQPLADWSFGLEAIFDNNAHEIHTTSVDGNIEFSNRFEMKRFDSTGVTRCQFNS